MHDRPSAPGARARARARAARGGAAALKAGQARSTAALPPRHAPRPGAGATRRALA